MTFYGWHVVAAVFVLAIFGWGLGFYGPPVYLHAVHELRGWSLNVVSTAVTVHFLFGAIVIASLPKLYRRFGVVRVTKAGSGVKVRSANRASALTNSSMPDPVALDLSTHCKC